LEQEVNSRKSASQPKSCKRSIRFTEEGNN
jgi:hypothetical protein